MYHPLSQKSSSKMRFEFPPNLAPPPRLIPSPISRISRSSARPTSLTTQSQNSHSLYTICHWSFEPPYSWTRLDLFEKRQSTWFTIHHHGLCWSDGWVPYCRLFDLLARVLASVVEITEMYEQRKMYDDDDHDDDYDVYFEDDQHSDTSRDTVDCEKDEGEENEEEDDEDDEDEDDDITVPTLKSMPSMNNSRYAFHNGRWRTCTKYGITCTANSNRNYRTQRRRQRER